MAITECDHPAADQERILRGDRIGEYVVQIGSDLAQGPSAKVDEAHDLCHLDTGATSYTLSLRDVRCSNCGAWWTEARVGPDRRGDNVDHGLLSI
jgi:hypothetical protein